LKGGTSFDKFGKGDGADKGQSAQDQNGIEERTGLQQNGENGDGVNEIDSDGIQGDHPVGDGGSPNDAIKEDGDGQSEQKEGDDQHPFDHQRVTSMMACSNLTKKRSRLSLYLLISMAWT